MILGKHIIAELYGVDKQLISREEVVKEIMDRVIEEAKISVVGTLWKQFNPHGVTGVALVSESHISIHTWPEFGYAALDVFTCRNIDPLLALDVILERLKPKHYMVMQLSRGDPYTEEIGNEGEVSEPASKIPVRVTVISGDKDKDIRDTIR